MDNPTPLSTVEREKEQALKREGYMRAMQDFSYQPSTLREHYAKMAFPDPPKPRETYIEGFKYRNNHGVIERRCASDGAWNPAHISAQFIRALCDLLDNPYSLHA